MKKTGLWERVDEIPGVRQPMQEATRTVLYDFIGSGAKYGRLNWEEAGFKSAAAAKKNVGDYLKSKPKMTVKVYLRDGKVYIARTDDCKPTEVEA